MDDHVDPIARIKELRLDDPALYAMPEAEQWLRWTPNEVDRAEPGLYREYVDHSCDLTMRGGTTSGVVYPLAVCSLARHYVFRSVGGASAGAIAASVTAAAEYGRRAVMMPESGPVPDDAVRPGFAGLAQIVHWLIGGTGNARWRLAQLFQPNPALRWAFRVVMAMMQGRTGRSRFWALLAAVLYAVNGFARLVVAVLVLVWLLGPAAQQWLLLPPDRWAGTPWLVATILAVAVLAAAIWVVRLAFLRLASAGIALLVPLVLGVATLIVWSLTGTHTTSAWGWVTVAAVLLLGWLAVTLATLAILAVIYASTCWKLITNVESFRYGLLPGASDGEVSGADRQAGVPAPTGVPPLVRWLADRIDDLAGFARGADGAHTRALTFGDLWAGPDRPRPSPEELARMAGDSGARVINLALMTTDLAGGRPYRLPFAPSTDPALRWQFCARCLEGLVPNRIILRLSGNGTSTVDCPRHRGERLRWLPEPWDLPVVLAARMSLPLPGMICPVPLCREGKVHWFSDGGITSNFPIHFFDALLPRWPTFGLNLDPLDKEVEDITDEEAVFLPEQNASSATEPWSGVSAALLGFVWRIIDTSLSWRDTMQAALPGFRGRIASVRMGRGEGGLNLFMPPAAIAGLALRGHLAGEVLKGQFDAEGTSRHRWIRMRLAMREYRGIAAQAKARTELYHNLVAHYQIPQAMSPWFATQPPSWPVSEPNAADIDGTLDILTSLANGQLSRPFDGTSPVKPVLRLTPPE